MDTPPASPVLDSPVPSLPISPARTKTRGVLQPTVAPLKSNPPSYLKPALTQQDSKLLLSQDPFAFSRLLKSYQDGAILVRSRDAKIKQQAQHLQEKEQRIKSLENKIAILQIRLEARERTIVEMRSRTSGEAGGGSVGRV